MIFKPVIMLSALLITFFVQINLSGQSAERLIKRGLEESYNFKWEEAQSTFRSLITQHPGDPKGYHYMSGIYLWYYLSSKEKEDYNNFFDYSDKAIQKAEDALDKNEKDADILYHLGAAYSYRAIAFAKAESYLDAAWASKKSESFLQDALKNDPQKYDAYLGLGLYNFAVSQIPAAFKWALNLAGINGSREEGIKFIKKAAAEGNYSKVEAGYYLSQLLSEVLYDYDAAYKELKRLNRLYPDNLIFSYAAGVIEIKRRNLPEAEKILKPISEDDAVKFKKVISFSNFLMGDINFRSNKFSKAKKYYHKFLSTSPDKDYKGIASYRLAVCYETEGDRSKAEKLFKSCGRGNPDLEDDLFAGRKGSIYSKRSLAEAEIALIKGGNLIEAGEYERAADSLNGILDGINDKFKGETYLLLSDAYYGMNDIAKSKESALLAKKANSNGESWIKPFAAYYAARAARKEGNEELFREMIKEAEGYSGYDYQNKLKNLIAALLI